jgi:hypothetical protein
MRRQRGSLVGLVFLCTACAGAVVTGPDDRTDPVRNFDQLWTEFDGYYSFFTIDQIDWDALYRLYRPEVTSATSPSSLFAVMAAMLDSLHDGHVSLHAPFADYYYTAQFGRAPRNFDFTIVAQGYLSGAGRTRQGLRYGRIDQTIGYLWIPTFGGNDLAADMDDALAHLEPMQALVVDVRDNEGGSDLNSTPMAGRLADVPRLYEFVQYRNGPAHDDFTALRPDSVRPEGPSQFTGPIALLTNRRTFSAAEDFALALRAMPFVVTIGDTTGGGAGNPIARELPNGWSYRIPRWIAYTADTTSYQGIGLPPDTTVWITPEDAAQMRDPILETAIGILQGGTP